MLCLMAPSSRRTALCAAFVLAGLIAAPPAAAQYVEEEPVGRLTIGGNIGALFPGMGDVNENFSVINRFLARDDIRSLSDIDVALVTGLDVRLKLTDRFSVGGNWGAYNARSEFDVTRARVRFYSRTTTYQGSVLYHLPGVVNLQERAQAYVGAGLIYLRSGTVDYELQDKTTNFFLRDGDLAELSGKGKAYGDGSGFLVFVGGSFQLSGRFSVAADFGYRSAAIEDLELDGEEIEGYLERFGTVDDDDDDEDIFREPGDWAIYDFFLRDPNGETVDGRKRTDPKVPEEDMTGCADCPIYFTGGPIEVDYSGFFTQIAFRIHFF